LDFKLNLPAEYGIENDLRSITIFVMQQADYVTKLKSAREIWFALGKWRPRGFGHWSVGDVRRNRVFRSFVTRLAAACVRFELCLV
jgi:hypothetical protein